MHKLVLHFVIGVAVVAAAQNKAPRPSEPGTAEATIGNAKVKIDYSRPKIRDPKTGQERKIFGGLVP